MRRTAYLAFVAMVLAVSTDFAPSEINPQPAVPALLRAFDQHPVVAIGEMHALRKAGQFYTSLLKDPEFSKYVDIVVLECADSRYQSTLDRYESGGDVPLDQLSHVWRDTTKVISWESPIYVSLLTTVREVNRGLPPERRIRVLAADSAIDWAQVHTHEQWLESLQGDEFAASLIEREVLATHKKALVIMGANHVTHGGNWRGDDDLTSLLEKKARRSVFVALLWGIPARRNQQLLTAQCRRCRY